MVALIFAYLISRVLGGWVDVWIVEECFFFFD